jgi:hypothetical protein
MTRTPARSRRPIWVWLISVFYFGFGASGVMAAAMALMLIHRGSVEPAQLPELKILLQSSLWGLLPAISMAGALSLFFMKKTAFPIFISLLALRTAMPAIFASHPALGLSQANSDMILGYALGYAILLGVCFYVYRLGKSGLLH